MQILFKITHLIRFHCMHGGSSELFGCSSGLKLWSSVLGAGSQGGHQGAQIRSVLCCGVISYQNLVLNVFLLQSVRDGSRGVQVSVLIWQFTRRTTT